MEQKFYCSIFTFSGIAPNETHEYVAVYYSEERKKIISMSEMIYLGEIWSLQELKNGKVGASKLSYKLFN